MVVSLHVAILQGGRGCTERGEEGEVQEGKGEAEEEEEKHQHLESGYSSTESSSPHFWSEEKEMGNEEERGERHSKMCWDYVHSQVIGACFHCMPMENSQHYTA